MNASFNSWVIPWLWQILGIIFLPFTTLMYVLVVGPLGPTNFWGWLVVGLGFLIDLPAPSPTLRPIATRFRAWREQTRNSSMRSLSSQGYEMSCPYKRKLPCSTSPREWCHLSTVTTPSSQGWELRK